MSQICPSCLHDNDPQEANCVVCGTPLTPPSSQPAATLPSGSVPPLHPSPNSSSHYQLHLQVGAVLKRGDYKIEKFLGQGGFGITYQGIYRPNSAKVAIKELWPESGYRQGTLVIWPPSITPNNRKEQIEKFKLESIYLQRCNSENIAKVYDCFEENSTIYMVMEFIDGRDLSAILKKQPRLSEDKIIHYSQQVLNALENVHDIGLLHRDIKPENIMIDGQDRAVLIDFGTAREFIAGKTGDMTVFLSPGYAPFEQYSPRGKRVPATDIYALSASLYELSTGELPAASSDRATAVHEGKPDPLIPPRQLNPNLSPYLERVILTGMRLRVEERIQSAQDFRKALQGQFVSPLHQTAKNYLIQGNLNQAIQVYQTCLEREPDNGEAAVEFALILVHLNHDDGTSALNIARQAQQLQPQDGRSYGVCGLVYCRRQQWNDAVAALQQGVRLSSKEAWMHANLAWALGKQGDWPAAETSIQQALQLNPDCTFSLGVKAWINFHQRQWKAVVRAGSQGMFKSQQRPKEVEIRLKSWVYPLVISALERATGKTGGDAQRRLQAFLRDVPQHPLALGLQAWYQYQHGNLAACRQSLDLARQAQNCPKWVDKNSLLVYEHLNDLTTAIQRYQTYRQQHPDSAWTNYRLGTLLAQRGDWQQAKTYLEAAVKESPNLAAAQHNLGWVLLNLRNSEGNVAAPQALLSAYRQGAIAYEQQGDRQKAQQVRSAFQALNINL
ncbi:serine/threonine-protein kinase [Geitlerinema sp. P-1104]|uniref:serine/threonine-protein kinase n=1 Tax=Geitlerinema sp. P-1104 TaxID=2546230 RepID=UPI001476E018|nr:serine/threonine-protein kinase [Geitlerinema sp. P-1104]NMG59538.1 serine/threonine-protein kinase [Geitlerinema sp. P-1104]